MGKIRLDKYISSSLIISRKDAAISIRNGSVCVNGKRIKNGDEKVDPESDIITFDGKNLTFSENIYVMLNKPQGLICSTEDARDKTVLSLFDETFSDKGLAPCGRLDKDTVGLLILTTDGELTHRLLSPKHHAEKVYFTRCDKPFTPSDASLFEKGIMMDGKMTKPAKLEICENPCEARITLTEGKFHEIKRLCYACGQKTVTFLKRETFGGLCLDESLEFGEWRFLTSEEVAILKNR